MFWVIFKSLIVVIDHPLPQTRVHQVTNGPASGTDIRSSTTPMYESHAYLRSRSSARDVPVPQSDK